MIFWEGLIYVLMPALFVIWGTIGFIALVGALIFFDWVTQNYEWWRLKAQMKRDRKVKK